MSVLVDRAFVRLREGLVHYRHAGAVSGTMAGGALPLYMAHAGPGSSRGLSPLLSVLGESRWTLAPDMLGNGDSDAPEWTVTDIPYYADCVVRVLDALGVEKVDFYGSHTGALIGMELARTHGDRVGAFVLDGVMLLSPTEQDYMLAHYAPPVTPDDHGGYLAWAYQFCRDMTLFYPYFERDAAHRTANGAQSPDDLHIFVVDVLKALKTYHCAYGAAFSYDAATALARITHPVLLSCARRDPLHADLAKAHALLPSAMTMLHEIDSTPRDIATRITGFLDGVSQSITA